MRSHSEIKQSAYKGICIKILTLCLLAFCGLQTLAVTDTEMDQARAIAGKFYVRYINDGAGYLDGYTPGSMAELENKLTNNTDKENLAKFKAAAYPSDYSAWDKSQLAEYWSTTFFKENASGLNAKAAENGVCKKQIRKAVESMKVSAPVKQEMQAEPVMTDTMSRTPEEAAIEASLASEAEKLQEAQALVDSQEAKEKEKGENSGTWVYVMILGILIAVVIFLVVYASRTMKSQPRQEAEGSDSREANTENTESNGSRERFQPATNVADETRMREKYAKNLAAKSEEIRLLSRQLNEMETLAADLKEENRQLKAKIEQMQNQAKFARKERSENENSFSSTKEESDFRGRERTREREHASERKKEIYLGRVNAKGLFVRADRHAVDGQSIFKLTTENGTSGTYTLIQNPLIMEQALEDPGRWLAGGCIAKDMFDTEGYEEIVTETPGKAVFRDGAWRVEKKTRIRYE